MRNSLRIGPGATRKNPASLGGLHSGDTQSSTHRSGGDTQDPAAGPRRGLRLFPACSMPVPKWCPGLDRWVRLSHNINYINHLGNYSLKSCPACSRPVSRLLLAACVVDVLLETRNE